MSRVWYRVTLFRDERDLSATLPAVIGVVTDLIAAGRTHRADGGVLLQRGYAGLPYFRICVDVDCPAQAEEVGRRLAAAGARAGVVEAAPAHLRGHADAVLGDFEIRPRRTSAEPAHNEVVVEPDDIQADLYGGESGVGLLREYLAENTRLMIELTRPAPADPNRAPASVNSVAFDQLLYTVRMLRRAEGLDNSSSSLRSHVEGFVASRSASERDRLHAGFEAAFQRNREPMVDRARLYWGALTDADTEFTDGGLTAEWCGCVDRIHRRASDGLRTGELRIGASDEDYSRRRSEYGRRSIHRPDAVLSDYHRYWAASSETAVYSASVEFEARRFILNLVYGGLPLLGITALTRYTLCHCVTRAVDESSKGRRGRLSRDDGSTRRRIDE